MLLLLVVLAAYVVFIAYDEYADILVGSGTNVWNSEDSTDDLLDGAEEPFWLNDLLLTAWKCLRKIDVNEVIKSQLPTSLIGISVDLGDAGPRLLAAKAVHTESFDDSLAVDLRFGWDSSFKASLALLNLITLLGVEKVGLRASVRMEFDRRKRPNAVFGEGRARLLGPTVLKAHFFGLLSYLLPLNFICNVFLGRLNTNWRLPASLDALAAPDVVPPVPTHMLCVRLMDLVGGEEGVSTKAKKDENPLLVVWINEEDPYVMFSLRQEHVPIQCTQCFDFPLTSDSIDGLSLHLQKVRGDAPEGAAIELPLADISQTTGEQDTRWFDLGEGGSRVQLQLHLDTPIPSEVKPIPSEVPPVPSEVEPISSEAKPIPSEVTPIPSEATPTSSEVTPISSEVTPISSEVKPISSEVPLVPPEVESIQSEVTPIESEVTPIKSEATPIESEVTPIPSEVTPTRAQGHSQAVLSVVIHEVLASWPLIPVVSLNTSNNPATSTTSRDCKLASKRWLLDDSFLLPVEDAASDKLVLRLLSSFEKKTKGFHVVKLTRDFKDATEDGKSLEHRESYALLAEKVLAVSDCANFNRTRIALGALESEGNPHQLVVSARVHYFGRWEP